MDDAVRQTEHLEGFDAEQLALRIEAAVDALPTKTLDAVVGLELELHGRAKLRAITTTLDYTAAIALAPPETKGKQTDAWDKRRRTYRSIRQGLTAMARKASAGIASVRVVFVQADGAAVADLEWVEAPKREGGRSCKQPTHGRQSKDAYTDVPALG